MQVKRFNKSSSTSENMTVTRPLAPWRGSPFILNSVSTVDTEVPKVSPCSWEKGKIYSYAPVAGLSLTVTIYRNIISDNRGAIIHRLTYSKYVFQVPTVHYCQSSQECYLSSFLSLSLSHPVPLSCLSVRGFIWSKLK